MVTFSVTFTDPYPVLKVTAFEIEYLKNGESFGQSNNSTKIGNHTKHKEWYHVWCPWLTLKRVVRFVSVSWGSCKTVEWTDCVSLQEIC